jgi:hypothetical protein
LLFDSARSVIPKIFRTPVIRRGLIPSESSLFAHETRLCQQRLVARCGPGPTRASITAGLHVSLRRPGRGPSQVAEVAARRPRSGAGRGGGTARGRGHRPGAGAPPGGGGGSAGAGRARGSCPRQPSSPGRPRTGRSTGKNEQDSRIHVGDRPLPVAGAARRGCEVLLSHLDKIKERHLSVQVTFKFKLFGIVRTAPQTRSRTRGAPPNHRHRRDFEYDAAKHAQARRAGLGATPGPGAPSRRPGAVPGIQESSLRPCAAYVRAALPVPVAAAPSIVSSASIRPRGARRT